MHACMHLRTFMPPLLSKHACMIYISLDRILSKEKGSGKQKTKPKDTTHILRQGVCNSTVSHWFDAEQMDNFSQSNVIFGHITDAWYISFS